MYAPRVGDIGRFDKSFHLLFEADLAAQPTFVLSCSLRILQVPRTLLSLIVAFAGYSMNNVGQAGQKIGLAYMRRSWLAGTLIWILASAGTTVAAFLLLYAVSLGSVALVGAMGGSGLASLALFSYLVLKEPIGGREIAGIAVIFGAAALIGVFHRALPPVAFKPPVLFLFLAAVCLIYLLLWAVFSRRHGSVGIVIAGFSGALGGVVPLFQKVSTSDYGRARSLLELEFQSTGRFVRLLERGAEIFSNPYALLWMVISVISMIVMQFSYRRDTAIRLVPFFASNYIAVPVLGALICFGERLHPLQWVGIVLIVVGVFLLTVKRQKRRDGSREARVPAQAGD
jgi:drug/metabolite transporter (DMT)-like permease